MDELMVTLPYSRLRTVALALGSQDCSICPPTATQCWMKRGISEQYFTELARIDAECPECWMTYLLKG